MLFKSHTAAHDQFIRNEILALMLADGSTKSVTHIMEGDRRARDNKKTNETEEWIEQSDFGASSSKRATRH